MNQFNAVFLHLRNVRRHLEYSQNDSVRYAAGFYLLVALHNFPKELRSTVKKVSELLADDRSSEAMNLLHDIENHMLGVPEDNSFQMNSEE